MVKSIINSGLKICLFIWWCIVSENSFAFEPIRSDEPNSEFNYIAILPSEILEKISENLDLMDIIHIAQTSLDNRYFVAPFLFETYFRMHGKKELTYDFGILSELKRFVRQSRYLGYDYDLSVISSTSKTITISSILSYYKYITKLEILTSQPDRGFFIILGRLVKMPLLEELYFDIPNLSSAQTLFLNQSHIFRNLITLSINKSKFGQEGISFLCQQQMPNLKELKLTSTRIKTKGAELLVSSKLFFQLEKLYIPGNEIGDKGVLAFVGITKPCKIKSINFAWNGISEDTAVRVTESFQNFPELTEYYFEDARFIGRTYYNHYELTGNPKTKIG